jgi:hypothetical protein
MVIKDNIVTKGLSGMLGGVIVFRQVRGKTVVSNRPRKPVRQSELQRENRVRFRAASSYAKEAMHDPEKKERYKIRARKLNLPNAYTAALTDYLRRPVVNTVKRGGRANDLITIKASKNGFALASVDVTMTDAQGSPLKTCPATLKDRVKGEWVVRLPVEMLTVNGDKGNDCRVVVMARDHTGNVVRRAIAA